MNSIEKDITKYIDGEMTLDEVAVFFKKIQDDQDAKDLLDAYVEMNTIYNDTDWELLDKNSNYKKIKEYTAFFESNKSKNIANIIKKSEEKYFSKKPVDLKWLYRSAIGIAAIFVIGFFVVSQIETTVDYQNIYANTKDWNSMLPSLTIRDSITNSSRVETLFRAQDYEASIALINKIESQEDGIDFQLLLYKGAIYLEKDNVSEAIAVFKRVLKEDTLDGAKAHWYIALCYLKQGNIEKTRGQLFKLINTTNFNKTKAEQLLEELR